MQRQGVLTVGKHVIGGVLERLEGLVLLEALGQMLGGLRVQSVEAEAANKGNIGVSAGADGRETGMSSVLEYLERRVRFEGLAERLCTLWSNAIAPETANKSQVVASGRADGRQTGAGWRT